MKYHIFDKNSKSGISKYALDFHNLVLKNSGWIAISPYEVTNNWISNLGHDDEFHLQLGALEFDEKNVLLRLIRAGHDKIDITIHDPPFLTFPYYRFPTKFLMQFSRAFDFFLNSFGIQRRVMRRFRRIFVLTERGSKMLKELGLKNIIQIPHIVDSKSIWFESSNLPPHILYFGFIGPSKGLEYALQLHQSILLTNPSILMHVIGDADGLKGKKFLSNLKSTYSRNVIYHGFVDEEGLYGIFSAVGHVFLPFKQYKYTNPASGSLINALKRGRIVWTTPVNSTKELIKHRQNGFFLSGNIELDKQSFIDATNNTYLLNDVRDNAIKTIAEISAYDYQKYFI